MNDQTSIAEIAAALAEATGSIYTVRCETAACRWAVHAGTPEKAQADYAEHLRTSPRHTGGKWIDRDGRERRGLEP
ncbi:hypothetical protein [Nocardia sp. NBC_01327]|uniref:hypothetical protein n=1 Tax=Nocardia sp. NBC_01327 TaxID=2903593 RepID=UPI002E0FD65B|nr:hypothetical protein OG326_23590 [Nocardia sp. NBC_01327]